MASAAVSRPALRGLTLFLATLFVGCAATTPPPPKTHHDPFVEQWIGKSKQQLIAALGQPTMQDSLSTGESTLVWEKQGGKCRISFNTDRNGRVDSGNNRCGAKEE